MFQRTADSLGQAEQDEACEVLEDPTEEIIAGYIIDVVKDYNDVFICIIDFFNLLHGVNKNRRKVLEEVIEVGRVQITVAKSPLGQIANTLKKSAMILISVQVLHVDLPAPADHHQPPHERRGSQGEWQREHAHNPP